MKWKQFGNKVFTGILAIALTIATLYIFADATRERTLFSDLVWWLIGLVILIIIGFIIWFVGFVCIHFVRDAWDMLTKTKEQRGEEKSRNKLLDDL